MGRQLKQFAALGLMSFAAATAAQGALTIGASDVVDSKYTYSLYYANFETQFAADVNDRYYMDPYKSGSSQQKYVRRATSSFEGICTFTYEFDFTNVGPGYTISGINTLEVVDTHTNDGIGGITIKYSTDGTNFTEKYHLQASTTGYNYIDSTFNPPDPNAFIYTASELKDSSVFYYRVEYEVIADTSAYLGMGNLAWGRRGPTATNPMFQANFTLQAVPEPAVMSLVLLTGGALLGRRRYA